MTMLTDTIEKPEERTQPKTESETTVMIRVSVPIRRVSRFWQMFRDESTSDFVSFGAHELEDFPTHRVLVVELTGQPKDISRDLDMLPKYRFYPKLVDNYESAVQLEGINVSKTARYDFHDEELDFNKKKNYDGSAFG